MEKIYSFFPQFSTRPPPPSPSPSPSPGGSSSPSNSGADAEEPAIEFSPETFERVAECIRRMNNHKYAKQLFDLMRKQEATRQVELKAGKAYHGFRQSEAAINQQLKFSEEQAEIYHQQAQVKAQNLRYEDELARKRMQTDHEAQRRHNAELANMQEQSSIRKEQAKRATEEQIQARLRQTEKERAEIERETIRVKARAEAEARAHEAKLTEEQKKRMLVDRINGEREKWLAAINTAFNHIEGRQ